MLRGSLTLLRQSISIVLSRNSAYSFWVDVPASQLSFLSRLTAHLGAWVKGYRKVLALHPPDVMLPAGIGRV